MTNVVEMPEPRMRRRVVRRQPATVTDLYEWRMEKIRQYPYMPDDEYDRYDPPVRKVAL
jgi:hypothetical protein